MAGTGTIDEELYANSDDDATSEDERLALSPADGYFGATSNQHAGREAGRGPMSANVPFVPNVMVEDPTLRQDSTAEAKAREAAEDASGPGDREAQSVSESAPEPAPHLSSVESRQPHDDTAATPTPLTTNVNQQTPQSRPAAGQSDPTQSPSVASPTRRQSTQRAQPTHLNDQNLYSDAPPAYTPGPSSSYGAITSGPLTHSPPAHERSTSNEQQPLLSPSSQHIPSFPEPDAPHIPSRRFHWTPSNKGFRKRSLLVLGAVVILITATVITIGLLIAPDHQKHDFVEEPVVTPADPDRDLEWTPLPGCRKAVNSRISLGQSYHFDSHRNLTILQLLSDQAIPYGRPVQTFGDVILRSSLGTRFSAGYFAIESLANHDALGFSYGSGPQSEAFKIMSPNEIEWHDELDPCLQLRVTLFVPPGAMLRALDIQTQHLDVRIEKGLVMSVAEAAEFLSFSGDIAAPPRPDGLGFAPYKIETPILVAQSISGLISGWFPIYDDLSLVTRFGNILATVGHKLLKSKRRGASELTVASLSGNITIRELGQLHTNDTIARDHTVFMDSESGHINAETLYSSSARFKSYYGDLNLSISPALASDCVKWGHASCTVDTRSKSGAIDVVINAPSSLPTSSFSMDAYTGDDTYDDGFAQFGKLGNMSALQSVHASETGDIRAHYPSIWEGEVYASALSGDMNYTGKGLVMKPQDAINKRMRGRKGTGHSLIIVSTRSGDQRVVIGDEGEV